MHAPSSQPTAIRLTIPDDFDARSADELTLRKTERVEVIELDSGHSDGWFLGKNLTRGGIGLFPGGMTATSSMKRSHTELASLYHQRIAILEISCSYQ